MHIFLVQLLGTGSVHIEDGSGRVTETGPARSQGAAIERHVGDVEIADQAFAVRCGFILALLRWRWLRARPACVATAKIAARDLCRAGGRNMVGRGIKKYLSCSRTQSLSRLAKNIFVGV